MTSLEQLQTELTAVNAAITAAYGGAEYEIRDGSTGRRLKRQDLKTLLARRAELELSIGRMDGSRGATFGMVIDGDSPLNR
jgi:hypothetical protein